MFVGRDLLDGYLGQNDKLRFFQSLDINSIRIDRIVYSKDKDRQIRAIKGIQGSFSVSFWQNILKKYGNRQFQNVASGEPGKYDYKAIKTKTWTRN